MRDRAWGNASRGLNARKPSGKAFRPAAESLEGRLVLNASLASIPTVTVPATLGYQLTLDGSASGAASQTYTATSTDPNIQVSPATGQFVTFNVTHTSSGGTDPSFSGAVTFQLFGDLTPHTAQEIATFVQNGFYNNKQLFRISPGFPGTSDFIIQGGSPNNTAAGGASSQPGTPFPDEFNQQLAFTGNYQIAMANSGADTNDTQFFFTASNSTPPVGPQFLNFHHTIFGQVVSGQNLVTQMTQVARGSDGTTPVNPVTITSATLSATNPNGVLHIDATNAVPGESATVTVTATDPGTNTTATQTFTVNVVADSNAPERPFVPTVPPITGNIVAGLNQTIGKGQTLKFRIPTVSPTPNDQLTYTVQGGVSNGAFTAIPTTTGTASVDQSTGIVTFTPASTFTGSFNMLIGVRDQKDRSGTGNLESPSNYEYHNITVTVNSSSTAVPLAPIALLQSQQVMINAPTPITLTSQNPNTGSTQTLTYTIVSNPGHGTITGFDPTTGKLIYTPAPNFTGFDKFQYTVTASGGGQTTLTSLPATVTLDVVNANTNAVRVIGDVLVVTPVPQTNRKAKNTIVVSENDTVNSSGPVLQVSVNGVVDQTQPLSANIDRIVVFGSKASDSITIDPSVTVPAVTLDGGHGGKNVLNAGSTPTREHGWFGRNTLVGGTDANELVGRAGHVKFRPTSTTDEIFAGVPKRRKEGHIQAPGGTFYKFVNGHIVAIPTPQPGPFAHVGRIHTRRS
jgi:cyclophilin family peptidyl-prolyl cis-trans isomerase